MKLSLICVALCMMITVMPSAEYPTIPFDMTEDLKGYSTFLTNFRNAVAAPVRSCGLPSTVGTPSKAGGYIYVDIKLSSTKMVTIGLDARGLYVWAYKDNIINRVNFILDAEKPARKNLFPDFPVRNTSFSGSYTSLQTYAGVNRLNIPLGIENLKGAIWSVYGKQASELKDRAEAKFVFTVVQMVSEAARFKFMEEALVRKIDNTKEFRYKMTAFQNDWNQISQAIHNAAPKCTTISNPSLVISTIGYRQEVKTVDQVKNDMGILLSK